MRSVLLSVTALIVSFSLLLAANGLQFVLLAVRGGQEGFSVESLGWISSAYFIGYLTGSLTCPRVIKSAGHIRTFAALGSIVSGVALAYALLPVEWAWLAMRLATGFCIAGLHLVTESWLNARASNEMRGRLLSIYGAAAFAGYASGPLLINLAPAGGFELFILSSIMISFALVPVTLTRASAPVIKEPTRERQKLSIATLYRKTPLGMVAMLLVSATHGAFFGLGAVFADRMGLDESRISIFMTTALLSGLALQYPIGWLSDRLDRRTVIAGVGAVSACASGLFTLALLTGQSGMAVLLVGAIATGGTIFAIYATVLAFTNDRMPQTSLVEAAAALSLSYGIGAACGAPAASYLMTLIGPAGLYVFIGAIMAVLALFAGYRMTRTEAPQSEESAFAATSASPGAVPLDPAYETDHSVEHKDG